MGKVLLDLFTGKMPAVVDGGFNWVDVRDVVAGAVAAEAGAPAGARYLLGGHWVDFVGIAAATERASGVPAPRFVSPMWLARLGAPMAAAATQLMGRRPLFTSTSLNSLRRHRYISSERARRELGYNARPFEETVAAAYESFRRIGAL
jgi:dihydroflavonol-4-reductase